MARTSTPSVRNILTTSLEDEQIQAFIESASLLIDDRLAGAGLSAPLLKQIELYLAAHFCTLDDPRAASDSEADLKTVYEGATGLGLDGSRYGQMAKALDSSGTLASLDQPGRRSALFRAGSERDHDTLFQTE